MIGKTLSHYEVLAELGQGGMGVVYKARDTLLGRLVAVKVLPPDLAADPARVDLLRREARAIAALNHPRIVTLYSVEESDGRLLLTMEYVEGRPLDQLIPKDGFRLPEFLKIAIPLADALASAHERKIVHRDLKPSNIILSPEGRPKILDFGIAKLRREEAADPPLGGAAVDTRLITEPLTLAGRLAGTVPYMSPEQLCREPVDHRSDIFSLGIIFWEMATGRHPFRVDDDSVASSILKQEPDSVADIRPDLPRQLGRIIRRCLEKDSERRTQSAQDLRNELEDLQLETSSPAAALPAWRRTRRRRRALPLGLLAVALVALVGGWLFSRQAAAPAPARPQYLAVEEDRIFPGDRGPEYYRAGVIATLHRRLSGLTGVLVAGDGDQPLPDVVVQADARRTAGRLYLGVRLLEPERGLELGKLVLDAGERELPALVDRAGRQIASSLAAALDRPFSYRARAAPVVDPAAFDLYLQAEAGAAADPVDHDTVQQLLAQSLAVDPDLALAHRLSGALYLEQHRATGEPALLARAETACRLATAADPRLGSAHACVGDAAMAQGRDLEAVASYRLAIQHDTSNFTPHRSLREAYLNLGLPARAEVDWKRLIRTHPTHWAGYYSLGTYYQDLERYEEALTQYRRALELAPRTPSAFAYLGTVYFYLGRYEEATVSLQRSIDIQPNWDAYYNLGGLNFSLRRFGEAVAAFEKAVELAPGDYRSYGRLGWACFWAPDRREEARGHLEQAVALAQAELERWPDDADALILQALFQALLGVREASLPALERALELRPGDPHYLFLAGLALSHLGDAEAALDHLEEAVRGGYSTADVRTTVDLDRLRDNPRFQQLLRTDGAGGT